MNTNRLIAALTIALALVAGACSSSNDDNTPSASPAATPTTATNTATDGTTEAPDSATDTSDQPDGPAQPEYEATQCWFEPPAGHNAECGYLVVPQDRTDRDGPRIRLAVARLLHPDGNPLPDPIMYLAGGPGERILQVLGNTRAYESFAELLVSNRDVILFDQRGVGFSEPQLGCQLGESYREVLDGDLNGSALSARAAGEWLGNETLGCSERLGASVDLSNFNTAASAADVNDLRQALGYEQINLWGVSYGTRLAQQVVRDYPDGVRSATIDAIMPRDLELIGFVEAANRAFTELFDACRAETDCARAFPDLDAVFAETVAGLDVDPPTITAQDPSSGEPFDVLLTGGLFSTLLYQALYDAGTIPFLPAVIYATSEGDYSAVADSVPAILELDVGQDFGMGLSVRCNQDRVNLPDLHQYDANTAAYPTLAGLVDLHFAFRPLTQICQDWDSGIADASLWEPVISDIPTLAMTGQFDPNLAPAWGQRVASTLHNSFYFNYPGIGHGSVGTHPCPTAMFLAFVDDPTAGPDASCMNDMAVEFETPPGEATAPGPIGMEPFENTGLGVVGVAPAGWTEIDNGVWTRSDPAADPTFLIQQALPAAEAAAALTGILAEFGGTALGDVVETIEIGDITWEVFAPEADLGIVMAAAVPGDRALVIALATPPDQLSALIEAVFQPAVAALEEETS